MQSDHSNTSTGTTTGKNRKPKKTVVTRFAPSPTGALHLGGLRTALFNWLHARHCGGKFLLRIEDTDRKRSSQEALDSIFQALSWCGLDPDAEPIYQSQRIDRHREIAQQLLDRGKAYRCYASAEELEEMRRTAHQRGLPMRYDGRWRDRDSAQAPQGIDPVVRLRAPREGHSVIDDIVQGHVRVDHDQLDDMVLLRSDGSPTYMLSAAIDDFDMGVNVVLRGDDHLTNTFRQQALYHALEWETPRWAHVPLLHGLDGKKLSKRHGAVDVREWRKNGYLPEALLNYLLRLGWGHKNEEIIPIAKAIEWFDPADIGQAAARFDPDRLAYLNAHYLREKSDDELLHALESFLDVSKGCRPNYVQRLRVVVGSLKVRAKTLTEMAEQATCFVQSRPLPITSQAQRFLDDGGRHRLGTLRPLLQQVSGWGAVALEEFCRAESARLGMSLKKVAQPLRAALTGMTVSPPIFLVMESLGRDECLGRIDDALAHAGTSGTLYPLMEKKNEEKK